MSCETCGDGYTQVRLVRVEWYTSVLYHSTPAIPT